MSQSHQIIIDPEFRALIPPLDEDEFSNLEDSLIAHGCMDPLVIWQEENILLDGHNRHEICTRLRIPFDTIEIELPDRLAARIWIRTNQMSRRNLSDGWKLELKLANKADLLEQGKAKKAHGKTAPGRTLLSNNDKSVDDSKHNTQKAIADDLGWSTGKVAQGEFTRKSAPEVWEQVLQGEKTIHSGYQEARRPHVANNSGDNEWYTPENYIQAAREVLGRIDLDPASHSDANQVIGADRYFTVADDGLAQDWNGSIWMNPPYASDLLGKFVNKLVQCVRAKSVSQAIVLVNNATETQWFAELASVATHICFPKGRIKFWHPRKSSTSLPRTLMVLLISMGKHLFISS